RAGAEQPRRRHSGRHLQPGGDLLLYPDGPDAVRRGDGGPEADLAPDPPAQVHSLAEAGGPGGADGGHRPDDGQGYQPALPEAGGRDRRPGAVDADADSAAAGERDAAAEPGGDGRRRGDHDRPRRPVAAAAARLADAQPGCGAAAAAGAATAGPGAGAAG